MIKTNDMKKVADKAFKDFLKAFDIDEIEFRGKAAYKFETDNLAGLLSGLTSCHEKIFRVILTTHIAMLPEDQRIIAAKNFKHFVSHYVDRATDELVIALESGTSFSKTFGIVK